MTTCFKYNQQSRTVSDKLYMRLCTTLQESILYFNCTCLVCYKESRLADNPLLYTKPSPDYKQQFLPRVPNQTTTTSLPQQLWQGLKVWLEHFPCYSGTTDRNRQGSTSTATEREQMHLPFACTAPTTINFSLLSNRML